MLNLSGAMAQVTQPCSMTSIIYTFSQETNLGGQVDVRVVVHRSAALVEAFTDLAKDTVDLRNDIANAADFAAEICERLNLLVPWPAASMSITSTIALGERMCIVAVFFFAT